MTAAARTFTLDSASPILAEERLQGLLGTADTFTASHVSREVGAAGRRAQRRRAHAEAATG